MTFMMQSNKVKQYNMMGGKNDEGTKQTIKRCSKTIWEHSATIQSKMMQNLRLKLVFKGLVYRTKKTIINLTGPAVLVKVFQV